MIVHIFGTNIRRLYLMDFWGWGRQETREIADGGTARWYDFTELHHDSREHRGEKEFCAKSWVKFMFPDPQTMGQFLVDEAPPGTFEDKEARLITIPPDDRFPGRRQNDFGEVIRQYKNGLAVNRELAAAVCREHQKCDILNNAGRAKLREIFDLAAQRFPNLEYVSVWY